MRSLSNAEYSRLLQNTLNLCNEKDGDGDDYSDSSDMLLQTHFLDKQNMKKSSQSLSNQSQTDIICYYWLQPWFHYIIISIVQILRNWIGTVNELGGPAV